MITEETMKHLTRVSPNNREARLALALHKRRSVGKNHAYTIDPGMALARDICRRNNGQQIIGHITSIVQDDHGIVVKGVIDIPDRTMPSIKQAWAAPTVETRVLDPFDIWAGRL